VFFEELDQIQNEHSGGVDREQKKEKGIVALYCSGKLSFCTNSNKFKNSVSCNNNDEEFKIEANSKFE
jgi:hypothetical protein